MYTYEMRVGYSVLDESLRMTLPAILDCFQDVSIFASEDSSISVDYLYSHNMIWLLGTWQLVIGRRPRMGEKIKIMTEPYEFRGFLGYRSFFMEDAEGNTIIKAVSMWTLLDTTTLLPAVPTQRMLDEYKLGKKPDMKILPRKIKLLGEMKEQERFTVRKYQIDSNNHMNNVEYVKLAMETLPENTEVGQLRVEYKKPAYYGEEVIAGVVKSGDKHQVVLDKADGDMYAIIEFEIQGQNHG